MSRNLSLAIITVALLVMFSSCLLQEASAWELVDHCMCKDVDRTFGLPFSRTNHFTPTDDFALCWLAIDITDLSGTIVITYMWYDPSNVLYAKGATSIPNGTSVFVVGVLHIKDQPPAERPGGWRVDVYVNGGPFRDKKLFTEYFTIAESVTIERLYPVTVSVSGVPSTFSADLWVDDEWVGTIAGGASKTFNFTYGTSHKFKVDAYIDATTDTRYYCSANTWTCSSEGSHTFGYHAQYYLTVNSAYRSPKGSGWYDSGSTATFYVIPSTLDHGNGTRHLFESWSGDITATSPSASIVLDRPKTVIADWKTQYQLAVTSGFGSITGGGWYDADSTATFDVTPSTLDRGNGTRHLFESWSGDSTATSPSASIVMDDPKTVKANWEKQYHLTVNSPYGSPTGIGWYSEKATAQFEVTSPIEHGNATRRVFMGWGGDSNAAIPIASIIMDDPKTVTANWKTQYQLAVTSGFGSITGGGWYDADSTATFSVTPSTLDHGNGTRRLFESWSGDITATTPSASVVLDSPRTATANWKTQYHLTVNSPYGSPTGIGWYDAGSLATFLAPSSYPMEDLLGVLGGKYVFQSWSGDLTGAAPTATVKMNGPKILTATWATDLTMPYAIIGSIIVAIGAAIGIVIKTRKKEVKPRKKQSRKFSR